MRQDIDGLEEQRTNLQLQCREAKHDIVKERTGASEAAETLEYLQIAGRVRSLNLKGKTSARVKRSMSFRVERKEGDAGMDPFACLQGTPTATGGGGEKVEETNIAIKHEEGGGGGGGEEKGEPAMVVTDWSPVLKGEEGGGGGGVPELNV